MSIEQLKSMLNSEFVMLPYRLSGPNAEADQLPALEEKLGLRAADLFANQGKVDRSKRKVTRSNFKLLIGAYFTKFVSSDGFSVAALEKEMRENKNTFERHLGKEWVYFLSTLIKLHKEVDKLDKRPRGLLGRSA